MYSQKSEFGNDMIAWNEYGPLPWGTTGMSYAAAMLSPVSAHCHICHPPFGKQPCSPRYLDELCETAEPHDVGLDDGDCAVLRGDDVSWGRDLALAASHLDELTEAVPSQGQWTHKSLRCWVSCLLGVLVLAGGELDVRQRLLELHVTVEVVRVENLFPPVDLDAGLLACLNEANQLPSASEFSLA